MSQHELFDEVSRAVASTMPRRQVLKLTLGLAAGAVAVKFRIPSVLRIPSVEPRTVCRCNGARLGPGQACCNRRIYSTATECCTPSGVQPKNPIVDLAKCPNRVPTKNPAYTNTPNGCGSAEHPVPNSFVFPGVGSANFRPCCDAHDICWGTCNNAQNPCDFAFGQCLVASCATSFPAKIIGSIGPYVFDLNKTPRNACFSTALVYYKTVNGQVSSRFGVPDYEASQRDACDCCPGDAPCCPPDRLLCDDVCCDPGEICFRGQASNFHKLGLACCPKGTVAICANDGKCCPTPCDDRFLCPSLPKYPPS